MEAADVSDGRSGDVFLVGHRRSGSRHVVLVTFVDFRERRLTTGGRLVRFNRKEDSPEVTGKILLRTPGFYQKQEGGDELDGAVSVDYSRVMSDQLGKGGMSIPDGSLSATAVFSWMYEPWLYCTSVAPKDRASAEKLERRFSKEKGPDASVAVIEDRTLFARQLGVDMALGIDTGRDTRINGIQLVRRHAWAVAFGGRTVDALVEVFHGPVAYRDEDLVIRKHSDLPDAVRTCFTKRTEFAEEQEYRFAVVVGDAKVDTIELGVSSALGDLMTVGHIRDGKWFQR